MADKAVPNVSLNAFLETVKKDKPEPEFVKAAVMPVLPHARISAVDDNKVAPAPMPALNPAAEMLKRLYGL